MGQRLNSDHNKTLININMKKMKKHSAIKFRAYYLKDEGFKSLVKEEINKVRTQSKKLQKTKNIIL